MNAVPTDAESHDSSDILPVERIQPVLIRLLAGLGKPVVARDDACGETQALARFWQAAEPDGPLPVFLAAADAVWREATGQGLGIMLEPDANAWFGQRVTGVRGAPLSVVMLTMIEAINQSARPGMVLMNDLVRVWQRSVRNGWLTGPEATLPAPAAGSADTLQPE